MDLGKLLIPAFNKNKKRNIKDKTTFKTKGEYRKHNIKILLYEIYEKYRNKSLVRLEIILKNTFVHSNELKHHDIIKISNHHYLVVKTTMGKGFNILPINTNKQLIDGFYKISRQINIISEYRIYKSLIKHV